MYVSGNPLLKISTGNQKYDTFRQCLNCHGCLRLARQNGHFTNEINGLILLNHKYIAILKFINHSMIPMTDNPKIIKGIILLVNNTSRRKYANRITLLQFLRHILKICLHIRIFLNQFIQCHPHSPQQNLYMIVSFFPVQRPLIIHFFSRNIPLSFFITLTFVKIQP